MSKTAIINRKNEYTDSKFNFSYYHNVILFRNNSVKYHFHPIGKFFSTTEYDIIWGKDVGRRPVHENV